MLAHCPLLARSIPSQAGGLQIHPTLAQHGYESQAASAKTGKPIAVFAAPSATSSSAK